MNMNQLNLNLVILIIIVLIFNFIAIPAIFFHQNLFNQQEYSKAELLLTQLGQSVKEWKRRNGYYPKDTSEGEIPGMLNDYVKWSNQIPFNSVLDYDNWNLGNGFCYVQIAFWGKNRRRAYEFDRPLAQPGELKKIEDDLVLGIDIYSCREEEKPHD